MESPGSQVVVSGPDGARLGSFGLTGARVTVGRLADAHYRDGFLALPANARCPLPGNAGFRLASAADKRATAAKEQFVGAFDPLATEFGGRTWSAGEF